MKLKEICNIKKRKYYKIFVVIFKLKGIIIFIARYIWKNKYSLIKMFKYKLLQITCTYYEYSQWIAYCIVIKYVIAYVK
jgi:hypothetical protein